MQHQLDNVNSQDLSQLGCPNEERNSPWNLSPPNCLPREHGANRTSQHFIERSNRKAALSPPFPLQPILPFSLWKMQLNQSQKRIYIIEVPILKILNKTMISRLRKTPHRLIQKRENHCFLIESNGERPGKTYFNTFSPTHVSSQKHTRTNSHMTLKLVQTHLC